ncbi:MAG: M28 family peptidase [Crocinitomicaceae bacterium]|nr:M28 family peptidase [Crocinitomicaceae bacterium]
MKLWQSLFKNYVADLIKNKYIVVIVALFCTSFSFSQVDEVKKMVQQLCSPSFHGRGYVNGGDSIAAAFIANAFQTKGLQKVGASYYQRFSFPVNTFPDKASFVVKKTDNSEEALIVGRDVLVKENSPSYHGTLIYRIVPTKLLFVEDSIQQIVRKAMEGNSYNSIAIDLRGVGSDTLKILKGVEKQFAQFAPVVVITEGKFTWSVAGEQLNNPIFELQANKADGSPIKIQLDAKLQPNHSTQNVVGFIPAKKKTKSTIVFTAHYDHLGRLGQETYFPGGNDNASGTAMLIALADYFSKNPMNYNVLFIAFAGEEIGLLGSKYYTENPLMPLKDIRFLINLDIFGSGEDGITVVNGAIFQDYFDLLTAINDEKQLLTQIKARGYAANSDHYWFTEKGVPSFFIYTMGPNRNYHDIDDTYENLSFAEVNDLHTLLLSFIEKIDTLKKK